MQSHDLVGSGDQLVDEILFAVDSYYHVIVSVWVLTLQYRQLFAHGPKSMLPLSFSFKWAPWNACLTRAAVDNNHVELASDVF